MEFESNQNNVVAKIPLLKQSDYDTWKIKIEQFFQIQDYALWEVIEFQKLVSQLAILGENISQEDLNLKFLRSLPTEWNTHVIVWRNKPDIGMMNIDELYNNFKIVEQEVKRSGASSSDPSTQNVAFISTLSNSNDAKPLSVQVNTASTPISTQIHDDDLEEMDLKWNMALISVRARKFYHRTGRKLVIDGGDTAGFDKSKIECFNCHKLGHFARECRGPRHQDNRSRSQDFRNKSQESSKKSVIVEETSPTAMIAFDGGGFDWSYMAEEEAPTNMALMAFSDSEDSEIDVLKTLVEKLKKEKKGIKIKVDGFENASKNLDTLVTSQNSINKNKGIGFDKYNAVAPLPTGMFAPPTVDLSNSGLKEFEQPEFPGYGAKVNECVNEKSSNEPKKHPEAPIIEDWMTDNEDDEPEINVVEKVQRDNKQAEEPRKSSETPRNNKSSWTKPISKKSRVGYPFKPKACFMCGSFSHLIKDCDFHDKRMAQKSGLNNGGKGTGIREARPVWTNAMRINHQNFSTSRRNFMPTAVMTKTGQVQISTGKSVNTACSKTSFNNGKSKQNVFQKPYSSTKRPFNNQTTFKNKNVNKTVNSARTNLVNSGSAKGMPNAVGKAGVNAVKSSSCWTWRQNGNIIDHGDPHVPLKDTRIFDSGCSRHMTGNKSYLRIMMKDLLLLLEVLREMCDRKNSVLFTETECLILSPEFKLPDETQVMLKIPRKDNMYSFDLKNIVPSKGLTCLIAKATTDESNMEFSNARTLQQNGVAERKNRTLIEAARTMLADSLLPIPFWAEAINIACYIQNRVLVTKPHNKTPYELLLGRPPTVSFMRPFGCPVTILNTLDHLGKFDGKADEGFLVGYSINSKAFRVYNSRTRKVEENLHVNFLKNKENVAGSRPEWLFDIDILSKSMNYHPVNTGNRFNGNAGLERTSDAGKVDKVYILDQEYILLPLLHTNSHVSSRDEEDDSSSKSDAELNNA
ncbi:ribonuclease H-like domain-containing protein, partial [Tanacetum coccineum]